MSNTVQATQNYAQEIENMKNTSNNATQNSTNNAEETKTMNNTNNAQNTTNTTQEFTNTQLRKIRFEARKFLSENHKDTDLPVNVTKETKDLFNNELGQTILKHWEEYCNAQDKIDALPRSAEPEVKKARAALTAIRKTADVEGGKAIHKFIFTEEIEKTLAEISKTSIAGAEKTKIRLVTNLLDQLGLKVQNQTDIAKMYAKIYQMTGTKEGGFGAMYKGNSGRLAASDFHHQIVRMVIILLSKQQIREREQKKAEEARAKAEREQAKREEREQKKQERAQKAIQKALEQAQKKAEREAKKAQKEAEKKAKAEAKANKAPKTTNKNTKQANAQ